MERSAQKLRLARFIRENQEPILVEFQEFARTQTNAGDTMDIPALRDHAAGMLSEIVLDIEQPQGEADQERKSKSRAPDDGNSADTAAKKHGFDRADHGFTLEEMISEYRALRASVLSLWSEGRGALDDTDMRDLIRFNKSLDVALKEGLTTYTTGLDHSREMFLAILGHDLRTPLNAIVAASSFLTTDGELNERDLNLAERIYSSGTRMDGLVNDLLDFTRSRLGKGIPITPIEIDLAEIGRDAVDECQATHSTGELRFEVSGDVRGEWDPGRVNQALCNLIDNAVQHGAASTPIVVTARGEADEVVFSIHNHGRVIEPEEQEAIFDPFERVETEEGESAPPRSLGLGLYIAKQIARAHGGSIDLRSSVEDGTTFDLHLPRLAPS